MGGGGGEGGGGAVSIWTVLGVGVYENVWPNRPRLFNRAKVNKTRLDEDIDNLVVSVTSKARSRH